MASPSNAEFGLNLLNLLAKEKAQDNLFLSPFSLSVALAMTCLGAKGQTADGIQKALCWNTDGDVIHKEFQEYVELLQKPSDGCVLKTATRMCVEKRFPILDDFSEKTKKFYHAETAAADFMESGNDERMKINAWVEEQTEMKIKDLIQEGLLTKDTRMILVNAVYFKGEWKTKFDKCATKIQKFHISPTNEVFAITMTVTDHFPYYKADEYTMIELPYKGDNLSLVVFLPDERFGLQSFEQGLTVTEMKESFSKLTSVKVELSLPKFEVDNYFSMKDPLIKLGMEAAFEAKAADLSGITGTRDLCISDVVHKTYLKVDEEGTEAAAATGEMAMALSCPMQQETVMKVDHPFLVMLRDRSNDMILFMGHITQLLDIRVWRQQQQMMMAENQ